MTVRFRLNWVIDDLHVSIEPPASGHPWCLDVDVKRPSTGEREPMLWHALTPWNLVRRDSGLSMPLSDLSPLRKPDLLLTADQGMGDIVQHWRYVAPLSERFGSVRVRCRPELVRLLDLQGLRLSFVAPDAPQNADELSVALSRLDSLFPDPTGGEAYLSAAVPRRARSEGGRWRVGLNWAANARGAANSVKSVPLPLLERIVGARPDVEWVSVQWGADERQLEVLPWSAGIEPLGRGIADAADLATAIAGLDLLITIDSAPAHIAGALGVPVWTLLSRPCSWRWGLDAAANPFYRSMRLIRQAVPGEWDAAIAEVQRHLERSEAILPLDPVPEPAAILPPGMDLRADTLEAALGACGQHEDLRAAFVAQPLSLLGSLGISMTGEDFRGLADVFKAMVDCHGGFSWCTPLPAAERSRRAAWVVGTRQPQWATWPG